MKAGGDIGDALRAAWRTSERVTSYLVENIPAGLWEQGIPGKPRQTVRGMAAHVHNSRCSWVRALGARHGVTVPAPVDARRVRQGELRRALVRSGRGIAALLDLGLARGGAVPRALWQNFPPDVAHYLCYFVAHEAHHRGQIVLVARQLGQPLPREAVYGLWQWNRRTRE
jgi:uncharacterized damage-inducible protein DinB